MPINPVDNRLSVLRTTESLKINTTDNNKLQLSQEQQAKNINRGTKQLVETIHSQDRANSAKIDAKEEKKQDNNNKNKKKKPGKTKYNIKDDKVNCEAREDPLGGKEKTSIKCNRDSSVSKFDVRI